MLSRAELSLATSQIAVARAQQPNTKEFAGFELAEAIAVTTTLKEVGTPVPTMTPKARATLAQIEGTPAGPAFDKAFIAAQLQNHIELRDLTEAYLAHTSRCARSRPRPRAAIWQSCRWRCSRNTS